MTKNTSDASFQADVLNQQGLVLVDFWAEWCGPCKAIAPVLEELEKVFEGSLTVVKLNIDDNADMPVRFGVRSIPTLMLFKNGEALQTKVGLLPRSALEEWIKEAL
jgi:thioredoxin 1